MYFFFLFKKFAQIRIMGNLLFSIIAHFRKIKGDIARFLFRNVTTDLSIIMPPYEELGVIIALHTSDIRSVRKQTLSDHQT